MKTISIVVVLLLVTIGLSVISYSSNTAHNEKAVSSLQPGQINDVSFLFDKRTYLCNHCCLQQYQDCRKLGGCNSPTWISDCTHNCVVNSIPTDCGGAGGSYPHAPPGS
jgi:hypothetical protein